MSAVATHRVREEWRARVAAEYTSAAITQHLVLWLIQAGAPPDLIDAGLEVVADELAHSRMSHEVYVAAGGTAPPAIDRAQLALESSGRLEADILRVAVRVFCIGETVAVPLFAHLREHCTQPSARAALDRILRDEVRHRALGWDLLDWLFTTMPDCKERVADTLQAMLFEAYTAYGDDNPAVAGDTGELTDEDRAWGLAPPRDYSTILDETIEKEFRPRFAARGIRL